MARSIPIGASADTSIVSRQLQGFRDLKVWDDTGVLETSTYESLTMDTQEVKRMLTSFIRSLTPDA